MEKDFWLTDRYYIDNDLDTLVTKVQLKYENMQYLYKDEDTGEIYLTIPLIYEYRLYKDDLEFLLKRYAEANNLKISSGSLVDFLTDKFIDDNHLYDKAKDILDESPEIKNLMLDHCREQAKKEFLISFDYWVDKDDVDEYLETDYIE